MRHIGIIIALATLGCGASHDPTLDTDAAVLVDGGVCHAGDTPPFIGCPPIEYAPHVCGDVGTLPSCVDGAWQCPSTMTGTCWCSGQVVHAPDCVCTMSGWSCPDVDAGVASSCLTAVEGEACSPEGLHCSGACSDRCAFCSSFTCTSGHWVRLEAFPDPTCAGTFACGPSTRCDRHTEYCDRVLSDIGGVPDDYTCRPFPSACTTADCACFVGGCTDDGDGGVTETTGGG